MTEREKRKATAPPPTDSDTPRSTKRQRFPGPLDGDDLPDSTREIGLRFIESLRNAKDKHGRHIATEFLTLPDRNTPGYYKQIKLPIAIDTLEDKLKKHQYHSLSELESDVKRMVTNAKLFNAKGSAIYDDAERVRKTASNFMVKHNPAYKNPNYVAIATPIPDDLLGDTDPEEAEQSVEVSIRGSVRTHSRRSSRIVDRRKSGGAATDPDSDPEEDEEEEDAEGEEEDLEEEDLGSAERFKGKSFQQAQDLIIEELIDYTEDGLQIYTPFINLPSRSLSDYYQVIRRPVSLKQIQKRVRGNHGRGLPTGLTDFQTWAAFEEEVSLVWVNAQTYNEDGSEMYLLAGDFKEDFKGKLAEAKAFVEQPKQQTVKIKISEPKLKIKLGVAKDSPGSTPGPSTPGLDRGTPGVIVHNEALERQNQVVSAGMNGVRSSVNGSRNPLSSSATPVPALSAKSRSDSAPSPPRQVNGVKSEGSGAAPSPAPGAVNPAVAASLRPASGSPHPQAAPLAALLPSLYPSNHLAAHHTTAYWDGPPPDLVDSNVRPRNQDPSEYLLPYTQLRTHPALSLLKPFRVRIPASSTSLHQSVTFSLSGSHYYLQVTPHIPVGLTNQPYRLFVTVNGTRLSEIVKPASGERDKSKPLFEARLDRGAVNKIEVEILAGKAGFHTGEKDEVEWEKLTCFVHCLRT